MPGRCSPVRMSTTPGRLRAAETSIDLDKNTQNRATQRSPTACRPCRQALPVEQTALFQAQEQVVFSGVVQFPQPTVVHLPLVW